MRKVSSTTSYSEFRKKNLNTNADGIAKHVDGMMEIDDLARQLDSLGARKSLGIQDKYRGHHGIIEEDQEDESSQIKLVKRVDNESITVNRFSSKNFNLDLHGNKKAQPSNKLNKSMGSSKPSNTHKIEQPQLTDRHRNQQKGHTHNMTKPINKFKQERRQSMKNTEQPSLMSTSTSVSPSIDYANDSSKRKIERQIQGVIQRIGQKPIPMHALDEIFCKLEQIDRILDRC